MKITLPLGVALLAVAVVDPAPARAQTSPPPPPPSTSAPVPTPPPPSGLEEEPLPPSFKTLSASDSSSARTPVQDLAVTAPPPPRRPSATHNPDSYLPSLAGPIGLYRVSTAEVGPENHLRLALHGSYFKSSEFLIHNDTDTRIDGAFTFGYTPHKYFEIFGALLTSSNRNRRPSEVDRRDPELIKSFGDLVLGPKVVTPVAEGTTIGFELGLRFLSSISDLSFSPDSTSMWVGPVFSLDLRPVSDIPLRFHANANYYLDNSRNLFDFTNVSQRTQLVAMFAYGIAGSRLRFALGMDAPLEKLTGSIPLQPFAEYHLEVVTDDADPAFMDVPNDTRSRDQQWLTFGLRARLYRGLTVDAGADVRLRSTGYVYGPPLAPYNVVFGLSYPLDIEAFRRPVVVTRTVERPALAPPPPEEGRIAGAITNSKDGKPVSGAIVAVAGRPRARFATDPDGTFLTAPLAPGPAKLEVSAPGFEATTVDAAVNAGAMPVELKVALTPKIQTGNVRGKLADPMGQGVQGSLRFASGTEAFEAKSDTGGQFSAALPVGPYKVTAEAPGFPSKEIPLDITAGQDQKIEIVMRTPNPDVTLSTDGIALRQPIKFKGGTAAPKLDPKVQSELDGVADLLADHPEIKTLTVEAHWDASAGAGAKAITEKQAAAVKEYLVKKGVAAARVEAVGAGADKPLVPNIGPANKAKNRRVELRTAQ